MYTIATCKMEQEIASGNFTLTVILFLWMIDFCEWAIWFLFSVLRVWRPLRIGLSMMTNKKHFVRLTVSLSPLWFCFQVFFGLNHKLLLLRISNCLFSFCCLRKIVCMLLLSKTSIWRMLCRSKCIVKTWLSKTKSSYL